MPLNNSTKTSIVFVHSNTSHRLLSRSSSLKYTTNRSDFFSQRVLKYWNKLPDNVKDSCNVNSFKNNLDKFRQLNYQKANVKNQFWDLSEEYLERIEVDSISRLKYMNYMTDHPLYAKHRKVNIH